MKYTGAAAAALAVLILAPAAAQARPGSFTECDGFVAPFPKGDGMTGVSFLGMKMAGSTQTKLSTLPGGGGVLSCDEALADPKLKPEYWLRRVSLLEARAIHRLEKGDAAGALADLELARAAVQQPDDVFYHRSLALDLDLTRAVALRMSGNAPGGEALALSAWRQRPWNLSVTLSTVNVLGQSGLEPRNEPLLYAFAQLQPRTLDFFFLRAFVSGRWEETVALYPQLSSPRTRGQYYDGNEYDYLNPVVVEPFWARRAAETAVALMALGRTDEAHAMMAAARKRLVDATRDPPPPPEIPTGNMANTKSFRYVAPTREDIIKAKDARAAYDRTVALNRRIAGAAGRTLDDWQAIIDQLSAARSAPAAAVLLTLKGSPNLDAGAAMATIDILLARPDAASLRAELLAERNRRLAAVPSHGVEIKPHRLFDLLPDAETANLITRFHRKNDLWGLGPEDGFSSGPAKKTLDGPTEPGTLIAAFRGRDSPKAMVEDLALLKAADAARAAGFHGFIILDRSDTQFIQTTEVGQTSGLPLGWESKLYILPVDPKALPAKYRATPWRVVDADAVWSALSPIYAPPVVAVPH
ncbi:MAG: hypothetical protein JWP35_3480 [Caulobacter sp.]|nr:hypothetical protein [Caulobacter sp.]